MWKMEVTEYDEDLNTASTFVCHVQLVLVQLYVFSASSNGNAQSMTGFTLPMNSGVCK